MKYCFIVGILIIISISAASQPIKYEFRGAWVSTVANIDWPSTSGISSADQQNEIGTILDMLKKNGINAVILQVRPCSDAIYNSEFEPWSKYLSGKQGVPPEPYYDPLAYWIEQAHKRGMELHAWFNPYRIQQNIEDTLADNHIINQHPDWGWVYGTKRYFEPGHPGVWQFITKVVTDVVSRYDIDAVHFDDYFYPYSIQGQAIPDSMAFKMFGGIYYPERIEDWRRHNVDTIIQILSQAIKETKPWVKFGISPFGVWRNRDQDLMGSETTAGTTNYESLYADIIKWQRLGWIDYTLPQLYWHEGHQTANFQNLAYWWADHAFGRSMYLGLAPYRIQNDAIEKAWRNPKNLVFQIRALRTIQNIHGFCFFSSNHFSRKELNPFTKKLQTQLCRYPAIIPPMPWIDNTAPLPPNGLMVQGNTIVWKNIDSMVEKDSARFFVIYHFKKNENSSLKKPKNVIAIVGENRFDSPHNLKKGLYRISALDRLNNESPLSEPIIIP